MYSASAEMCAIDLYFLLYQETVVDPMLKISLDVLFLSDGLPTQSASVKPSSFTPSICLYYRNLLNNEDLSTDIILITH